jgi:hypothetical protein
MKIYVSHSREFNFEDELYKPLKSPAFMEYDFFFPHENGKDVNTLDEVKKSDLILAEVSFPSTGQGIECGWASMLNIPILCITKEGSKISGSLKHLTDKCIVYSNETDLVSKLTAFLNK